MSPSKSNQGKPPIYNAFPTMRMMIEKHQKVKYYLKNQRSMRKGGLSGLPCIDLILQLIVYYILKQFFF
jgi:hypothetical protein